MSLYHVLTPDSPAFVYTLLCPRVCTPTSLFFGLLTVGCVPRAGGIVSLKVSPVVFYRPWCLSVFHPKILDSAVMYVSLVVPLAFPNEIASSFASLAFFSPILARNLVTPKNLRFLRFCYLVVVLLDFSDADDSPLLFRASLVSRSLVSPTRALSRID